MCSTATQELIRGVEQDITRRRNGSAHWYHVDESPATSGWGTGQGQRSIQELCRVWSVLPPRETPLSNLDAVGDLSIDERLGLRIAGLRRETRSTVALCRVWDVRQADKRRRRDRHGRWPQQELRRSFPSAPQSLRGLGEVGTCALLD